jgi:outer membrane protein
MSRAFVAMLAFVWLIALIGPGRASAETLARALAAAYIANPEIKAERARLRALDEDVARANSGYRPIIQGEAVQSYQRVSPSGPGPGDGVSYPRSYSLGLSQPLFTGFQVTNSVEAAKAGVEAGREDLRSVEQRVLLEAVTAYMDVLRDEALLRLQQNNLRVLSEQLEATRNRREVGEVTRTDVAQAEARRAGAQSQVNLAQANLQASRAAFERIIGYPPTSLKTPAPIDRLIPASLEHALQSGEMRSPQILAGLFRERASQFDIKRIKGELLPQVSLEASYSKRFDTGGISDEQETTTVTGRVQVPLYQGGEVSARIRQAQDINLQRRQEVDLARQRVRAEVISAWGVLVSTRAAIVSDQAQVEANRIALEGVREEERVGQRTVLDVLDAEQDLLNSQVSLVTTRRDLVVASYSVVAAIGSLSPDELQLPTELYDPDTHYRAVKDLPFGFDWSTSVLPFEEPVTIGGEAELEPGGDVHTPFSTSIDLGASDDGAFYAEPEPEPEFNFFKP